LIVVAWYKADSHFYSWNNSDDALRPFPPGSNTMSLAFGREPSCVYQPMLFHGQPFPHQSLSSPPQQSASEPDEQSK